MTDMDAKTEETQETEAKKPKKLTKRQQIFVENYLRLWKAAPAARAAGYKDSKSLYETASQLLRNPNIQAEISRRVAEITMSADEVLLRLADQARGNFRPFVRISEDGFVYFDFSNPEAEAHLHLVKKIETKRARRVEGKGEQAEQWEDEWVRVELVDSQAALALLARHHKLLVDRVDQTTNGKDMPPATVNVYIPNNGRD